MTLREEENCKHLIFGSICGIEHIGLIRKTRIYYRFMNCTDCVDECNANCPYRSGKKFHSLHFNLNTYAWEDREISEARWKMEKLLTISQIKECEDE